MINSPGDRYDEEVIAPQEVRHQRKHPYLFEEQVREHLGQRITRFREARELLQDLSEECIDGRRKLDPAFDEAGEGDFGVIAYPGGNMGLLLLKVVAALRSARRARGPGGESDRTLRLHEGVIDELFGEYVREFGKFYLHSDQHALAHLLSRLKDGGGADLSMEQLQRFLRDGPPQSLRSAILEEIVKPENMGCGHLKLLLQDPEHYGVPPDLVQEFQSIAQGFIVAFFRKLWDGADPDHDDLKFVVLDGDHREGAALRIYIGGKERRLDDRTMVPLVAPSRNGVQLFVLHPQAAQYLLQQPESRRFAEAILQRLGGGGSLDDQYDRDVEHLQETHVLATASQLARGRPVYDIVVQEEDGSYSVDHVMDVQAEAA